jgi:hypothetical protein
VELLVNGIRSDVGHSVQWTNPVSPLDT